MRQKTMRTVKHRPIHDFKLRMSPSDPSHPVIGYYELRSGDRGWRQLFETSDGLDLILDCWDSVNEVTVARWQSLFSNFDVLVEAALRVIPPPPIDPSSFNVDELVISHIFLNEPLRFLFTSPYCHETGESPIVGFSGFFPSFEVWAT